MPVRSSCGTARRAPGRPSARRSPPHRAPACPPPGRPRRPRAGPARPQAARRERASHNPRSRWRRSRPRLAAIPPCPEVLLREVLEQCAVLLQRREDDHLRELEQLERARVLDPIIDARALLAADHEALLAQYGQMLRRPTRVELERVLQTPDRALTVAQQLQQPDPRRVTQNSEEV